MTKFIDTTKGSTEKTKTVFTHILCGHNGWEETIRSAEFYEEIKYLGKCEIHGDMFSCVHKGHILILSGTKGSEFD